MVRFMMFAVAFVCLALVGEARADHCSGGSCSLGQGPVRGTAKVAGKTARRAGAVAKAAVLAPAKAVARVVRAKPARKALGALFCR